MKVKISDIVTIKFGLYTPAGQSTGAAYLQVRQFDDYGRLAFSADDFITLDEKVKPYLLKDGDILFAGKGNRLFAWCYRQHIGPAIASSVFFILRPNPAKVYPEYLVAMLNAPQSKAAFLQIGSGTNIFSIRKSELGAFEVPLPVMAQQKKIAALAKLHQQELYITQQLMEQKQQLYTALLSKLINN